MLEHGINVGVVTVSGALRGSVDADRYDKPTNTRSADHIPENFTVPMADPAEMLELLLAAAADPDRLELRWPEVPPIPYLD
jgi:hypothetical protein